MLEQLMGLMQDHSQEAIVNNPAIPNEHNEGAMQTILSSILGGIGQSSVQGNGGDLMSILSGAAGNSGGGAGLMSNPLVSGIAQNAISGLMDKFGIHNAAAQQIVAQVLPGVLSSMASKNADPNDSFNFGNLASAVLSGGGGQQGGMGGFGGLLGGLLGGK